MDWAVNQRAIRNVTKILKHLYKQVYFVNDRCKNNASLPAVAWPFSQMTTVSDPLHYDEWRIICWKDWTWEVGSQLT
jgi:hypothetical protein